MNEWMNEWMNEIINGWMNTWLNVWSSESMDGSMDEWMQLHHLPKPMVSFTLAVGLHNALLNMMTSYQLSVWLLLHEFLCVSPLVLSSTPNSLRICCLSFFCRKERVDVRPSQPATVNSHCGPELNSKQIYTINNYIQGTIDIYINVNLKQQSHLIANHKEYGFNLSNGLLWS